MRRSAAIAALLLCACADSSGAAVDADASASMDADDACFSPPGLGGLRGVGDPDDDHPNPRAIGRVVYELQVRSANACDPTVGSPEQRSACAAKPAPEIRYRAEDSRCAELEALERIRLGTLEDLVADTADFREGLTLRWIRERLGAGAVWLMPPFPNNDRRELPAGCDNVGSPYAVRDYMHLRGTLAEACIAAGRDAYSDVPCWGNEAFDRVLDDANDLGLEVWLDVAFNHFGQDYRLYDTAGATPLRRLRAAGLEADDLWDFEATWDPALVAPTVLDRPEALDALGAEEAPALAALRQTCPGVGGDALVRAFGAWRVAFDDERASFDCDADRLEDQLPAFYLSGRGPRPARDAAETTTAYGWNDVRFLFHHEDDPRWRWEALRVREYMFRVLNHWTARGVSGYRLDHATDSLSGLSPSDWAYVMAKVEFYAERRGQDRPIWLAEEFDRPTEMAELADAVTEGWLFEALGRGSIRDNARLRSVVERAYRFVGRTLVLTALETHDELRLTQDTGFDPWTGSGYWALGASTWSMPLIVAGQEFGESERLAFRRSHYLPARFEGSASYRADADRLVETYAGWIETLGRDDLPALRGAGRRAVVPAFASGDGVIGQLRWAQTGAPMLLVHNLWARSVSSEWRLPEDAAVGAGIDRCVDWQLRDVRTDEIVVSCRRGAVVLEGFELRMSADRRARWLAFERCDEG